MFYKNNAPNFHNILSEFVGIYRERWKGGLGGHCPSLNISNATTKFCEGKRGKSIGHVNICFGSSLAHVAKYTSREKK